MLLAVLIFGPNYAQIMLVFANMPLDLKIIRSAKCEKQVQKTYHDRVTILFGVTSSSSIVFCCLCLKPTVSGYVCWFWYRLLLQVIGRRGWQHLAKLQIMEGTVTNTTWQLPVPPFRARLLSSLGGSLSVTKPRMWLKYWTKMVSGLAMNTDYAIAVLTLKCQRKLC